MSERRLTGPEAVALVRFAKGCFPAMQVDEYTPDAWGEILAPLLFEDCKQALVDLGRQMAFAAASDVYQEVRKIRRQRIADYGLLPEPVSDLSAEDYQRWQWETTRAIADGKVLRTKPLPKMRQRMPPAEYGNVMPMLPGE